MLSKRSLALAGALTVLPQLAYADDAVRCVDVSVPRKAVEAQKGKWVELTPEQWQFLRGIYAMNPLTPPGLPYGDKAALAKVDGNPAAWCSSSTAIAPAPRWRRPRRCSRCSTTSPRRRSATRAADSDGGLTPSPREREKVSPKATDEGLSP